MALITDLPAASSLSNTDLLVIDTGSATQKIQAQNAGASASNAGLVTTGTQTLAGTKTFNGDLRNNRAGASGAGLGMYFSDMSNAEAGRILTVVENNGGRMYLREFCGGSSGVSNIFEQYRLPSPTQNRSAHGTFEILTTKGNITGSFSAATGVTVNIASVIRQLNQTVVISLYGTMPSATGSITIGTLSGITVPSFVYRGICGVGTQNYNVEGYAYFAIGTDGGITINRTNSAYTHFNINVVYPA